MTPATLHCPSCGVRLTVSAGAPRRLVCPRCRSWIDNPGGWQPGSAPLPVIPLEYESRRDATFTKFGLIPLVALLLIGSVVLISSNSRSMSFSGGFFAVLLVAIVAIVGLASKLERGSTAWIVVQVLAKVVLGFILLGAGLAMLIIGLCAGIIR
jgi:hypothetical protein